MVCYLSPERMISFRNDLLKISDFSWTWFWLRSRAFFNFGALQMHSKCTTVRCITIIIALPLLFLSVNKNDYYLFKKVFSKNERITNISCSRCQKFTKIWLHKSCNWGGGKVFRSFASIRSDFDSVKACYGSLQGKAPLILIFMDNYGAWRKR